MEFGISEPELEALSQKVGAFKEGPGLATGSAENFTLRETAFVALTDQLIEHRTITSES